MLGGGLVAGPAQTLAVPPRQRVCGRAVQERARRDRDKYDRLEHRSLGHRGLLDDEEREEDRGQPPRTEPPEKKERGRSQTRTEQAQRDRHHPHHGQTGQRVEHDTAVDVRPGTGEHRGTEHDEHQQRQELALGFAELVQPVADLPRRVARVSGRRRTPR